MTEVLDKLFEQEEECKHINTMETDGIIVCTDCGMESESLNFEAEWRWYGNSDGKGGKNPARCHSANTANGTLQKTLKQKGVPLAVGDVMIKFYNKILEKSEEGEYKKASQGACLYYAYQEFGEIKTHDDIAQQWNISKKSLSKGITKFLTVHSSYRTNQVKPESIIRRFFIDLQIDMRHYQRVVKLVRHLDNTSAVLNKSNTGSVAAAILYLYLCYLPENDKNKMGWTKAKFASQVGLSEITITRLAKEACDVLKLKIKI